MDEFGTFLSKHAPPVKEDAELRCEVLRVKKQLLQTALDLELRAGAGGGDGEQAAAEMLRIASPAQRYIDKPERILEPLSRRSSKSTSSLHGAGGASAAGGGSAIGGSRPGSGAGSSRSQHLQQPLLGSTAGSLSRVSSASSLLRNTGAMMSAASSAGSRALEENEPVLDRWSSKIKPFNIMVSTNPKQVRRRSSTMAGGTLAMGSGAMPFFGGSHRLAEGFFCSFRVIATDDDRRPGASALALGVTTVPPWDPRLQGAACPWLAYEVPNAVMVGYGDRFIEDYKWYKTPWDSSVVKLHDKVGLFFTTEGEIIIFVNDKQAVRVPTKLSPADRSPTLKLYPVVDLGGHVSGLELLPLKAPPVVQLTNAIHLERADARAA